MMANAGSVPPTLMALTPSGTMMYVPQNLSDGEAKDQFANTARLIAVGYNASAVAMILESWARFAKSSREPLENADVPPSQSPDREEVVAVMAEARDRCIQRFLFIQRNSAGQFTGFGTSLVPELDEVKGRFAQLIPPNVPSANDSAMARSLLEVMGVVLDDHGQNPIWN